MASVGSSLQRSSSINNKIGSIAGSLAKGQEIVRSQPFEPCAATSSLLLFAQGSTIVCLHHDTFALERRFEKHADSVQLIAVDNVSETGAGRLVVTYDVSQTAIIWDLQTGDQISGFASYEPLKVAAWMRNGNIAFGNTKGEVILFEPPTSEHISARTIFDPITALAPLADCKTYAIGYNNGSILLAALKPTFTILHTLTTSRAPSPIAALTWHASSSKQKSDMLATQTADGDLRVWSVSKPPTAEPPRIIRALKRSDIPKANRNWISWSKNGRILSFAESETWAWDVRTKHVSYEAIPLVENIRGIAAHGPSGKLFTLGPDHTVQQYDVESAQIILNTRQPPLKAPYAPPEEALRSTPGWSTSESEEEYLSPKLRSSQELHGQNRKDLNLTASPVSQRSGAGTSLSRTSSRLLHSRDTRSPANYSEPTVTSFSYGTQQPYQPSREYLPVTSVSPISARSGRKGSRLKQEVVVSPERQNPNDIFPITRARLSEIPYKQPRSMDQTNMTPDDLRRNMLSIVFGWEEDIRDLIRDELSHHPPNSQYAIFLSKWLDDDPDHLSEMIGSTTYSPHLDWMTLALGTISNQVEAKKLTQVFLEKLLSHGEIHAAATLLLTLGDRSDAIEVYVSRNQFMEAILLTALLTPTDWQRQSHLVRIWGEHVVENSEQHLAIRCFSCAGVEPSGPWTSPTAQMATKTFLPPIDVEESQQMQSFPLQYPAIFQKTLERRRTADKTATRSQTMPLIGQEDNSHVTQPHSALKLITSFGTQSGPFKFPGLRTAEQTPVNGATVTPIAESAVDRSALSPGGIASYRYNNPMSALSVKTATPSSFRRQRLSSIGETPIDVEPPPLPKPLTVPKSLPTPVDSGSEKEKDKINQNFPNQDKPGDSTSALLLLTSARYDPQANARRETPQTAVGPKPHMQLPDPKTSVLSAIAHNDSKTEDGSRTGSRNRKPDGLSIQPPRHADEDLPTSSAGYLSSFSRTESFSTSQLESNSELLNTSHGGPLNRNTKSPSLSGRSLDQYISSLEQAQYYGQNSRARGYSNTGRQTTDDGVERKKNRQKQTTASEDLRGRDDRRKIPPAKRSPSSPVPMSPEDLRMYSTSTESLNMVFNSNTSDFSKNTKSGTEATSKRSRHRSKSNRDTTRSHRSSSRKISGKKGSRNVSRQSSMERVDEPHQARGRSASRKETSSTRSPSSPQPMMPSEEDLQNRSDQDSAFRFVSQDRQRNNRSTSRRPRESSTGRQRSQERTRGVGRSRSRPSDNTAGLLAKAPGPNFIPQSALYSSKDISTNLNRSHTTSPFIKENHHPHDDKLDLSFELEPRSATSHSFGRGKKGAAAAELEARRQSLARRPSAPSIPIPGQNNAHTKSASIGHAPPPLLRSQTENLLGSRSQRSSPFSDLGRFEPPAEYRPERRPTPKALERHVVNKSGSSPETLSNNVFQPVIGVDVTRPTPETVSQLPKHPAYDTRIASSRNNSKSRGNSRSRSRPRASPDLNTDAPFEPSVMITNAGVSIPPILPELQHLAIPPPPPKDSPDLSNSREAGEIVVSTSTSNNTGSTSTAKMGSPDLNSSLGHRRGRSGNESSGQFVGRLMTLAGRIRSSSRGRDNVAMSPTIENDTSMPYETSIAQNLARVTEV